MNNLGIIGAGHLAGFLCEGLRRSKWKGEFIVSPHNTARAEAFRDSFEARIATSNQSLVDECDLILLAVRPDQCGSALREINLSDQTTLLSVMAGVPIATVAKLAPDATVVRAMPISAARINRSPTTQFPDNALCHQLLELLGPVTVLDSEQAFESATVNAAVYGWVIALIDQLVDANRNAGLSDEEARQVVVDTVSAAAGVCEDDDVNITDMLDQLVTPGGITAQGMSVLEDHNAMAAWREAWSAVNKRLQG